jgi:hypothetical protein
MKINLWNWHILPILAFLLIDNIEAAESLTINRRFIDPGNSFSIPGRTITSEDAPTNAVGEGNLEAVFNHAADIWETLILDNYTVNISFAWVDLKEIGVQALAVSPVFDSSIPPKNNIIGFNNNILGTWFIDPTPRQNEEHQKSEKIFADLGGGVLDIGQVYSNSSSISRNKYDLLSVAIHEIGHSLGFISAVPSFNVPGNPNLTFPSIKIDSGLPFTNTVIPTTPVGGGHINLPTALMFPFIEPGERKYPSTVDLLAIAQVSNFKQINLGFARQVKEPNVSWWGLGIIVAIGIVLRKNRYF